MEDQKIPVRNPEGYLDLTAHDALTKVMRDSAGQPFVRDEPDQRHYRLIKTLLNMIDLMDYDLLCRIEVKDRRSGRIYR